MFTMTQIFYQARDSCSERDYADSQSTMSVIKLGVRISMSRRSGCVTLSSTCLHNEYDFLCDKDINVILVHGWNTGVCIVAQSMTEIRIDWLKKELEAYLRKGIKGKRMSEALALELSEMQVKFNKLENYVRTKINIQHPECSQCQRQD